MHYLNNFSYFHPHQHGLRKHHTSDTQLFESVTDLQDNFDDFSTMDAIFVDFTKAFDTVPCERLLQSFFN